MSTSWTIGLLGSRRERTREGTIEAQAQTPRPEVRGKFLFLGEKKLYLRGVTYGTFRSSPAGDQYPPPAVVETDFRQMVESGVNTIRTYTVPPPWLLDLAWENGLWVMVGLAWEQHVAFLDSHARGASIEQRVREGVASCSGHPAVLCYALGNEIPASIVRWYGRRRVERFLERLCAAAQQEDPAALFTYVNYPSTEYLDLPFCDFLCFNVYLEEDEQLEAYLARLQNLSGDRPLVVAELGLDSIRNGHLQQAVTLGNQVRVSFAAGCAGVVVFAWTDEWHRGEHDVQDWAFGLVARDRRSKPALAAVSEAFAEVPFPDDEKWPRISVCVCTNNGAATLRDCLNGLAALDYPDFEVIVVDDGSSDASAAIAEEFAVQVISTPQRGLSAARNVGLAQASGSIVAYIDDDAWPDPGWLRYIAATFARAPYAGVGGPNVPPPGDGLVANCVARAPGGPVHILLTDDEAEHIPGCNMSFRKDALLAIGGFDEQFRIAGDDVDVCWRLQASGMVIGFHPAAMVWHHRRRSIRAYFRQQRGYGKAEALLERKWPEKYNRGGQLRWAGRIYEPSLRALYERRRRQIFYGTWGTGHFQSLYERKPGRYASLPMTPEWYLLMATLVAATVFESAVEPLFPFRIGGLSVAAAVLALCAAALVLQSWRVAGSSLTGATRGWWARRRQHLVIAILTVVQPLARLSGRLHKGLTPWRRRGMGTIAFPWPRTCAVWQERWQPPTEPLRRLEESLRDRGLAVVRGGAFDRWDIQLLAGSLAGGRVLLAVEEHGAGKQLLRYRIWPTFPLGALVSIGLLGVILAFAVERGALRSAAVLAIALLGLIVGMLHEAAASTSVALAAVERDCEPAGGAASQAELIELPTIDTTPLLTEVTLPLSGLRDA